MVMVIKRQRTPRAEDTLLTGALHTECRLSSPHRPSIWLSSSETAVSSSSLEIRIHPERRGLRTLNGDGTGAGYMDAGSGSRSVAGLVDVPCVHRMQCISVVGRSTCVVDCRLPLVVVVVSSSSSMEIEDCRLLRPPGIPIRRFRRLIRRFIRHVPHYIHVRSPHGLCTGRWRTDRFCSPILQLYRPRRSGRIPDDVSVVVARRRCTIRDPASGFRRRHV